MNESNSALVKISSIVYDMYIVVQMVENFIFLDMKFLKAGKL